MNPQEQCKTCKTRNCIKCDVLIKPEEQEPIFFGDERNEE